LNISVPEGTEVLKNMGKNIFKNKKGLGLGEAPAAVIMLVVIAIVLGIGASILTTVQTGQTANSIAYNASGFGLTGVNTFSQWVPTIAIVLAASLVIGLVMAYLMGRRN
jgi:NADH:ubiquinone oxidoreductase subunit 6 (subunit J)